MRNSGKGIKRGKRNCKLGHLAGGRANGHRGEGWKRVMGKNVREKRDMHARTGEDGVYASKQRRRERICGAWKNS